MAISVLRFARFVGETTVGGLARKLGVVARPVSVRDMGERFGGPLQPTNLHFFWPPDAPLIFPPDTDDVPTTIASFAWSDPGSGSPRAATAWRFELDLIASNGVTPADRRRFVGPPVLGLNFDFASRYSWRVVPENEFGLGQPSASYIFTTAPRITPPSPPPPPRPHPTPDPPPPETLVGISKLSLFNCQIEQHTVFIWVRDATGHGPWAQVQSILSQFNSGGQCPFDDNGILADSSAILTRTGEGGGVACVSGNIYQVSIVDPDRPTCEGRNDPTVGNCVVEDAPSFFKFNSAGDEVTLLLENGQLKPAPV